MTKKSDEKTITIGKLKAIALLMTHLVRENNISKEWTRGIDDFIEKVIEFVEENEWK